jgi:hypothetical protein
VGVAWVESRIQQWRRDGSLVTSPAGAIGVMQLKPETAAALGVDPTDPLQNIAGGVRYLAQMYAQFGSWPLALAAYNWGLGNVQRSGGKIPSSVQNYVNDVLGAGGANVSVFNAVSPQLPVDMNSNSGGTDAQATSPILVLGGIVAAWTIGDALIDWWNS